MKKPKLITLSILTILTIIPLIAFADAISDARQSALNFGTTYKDSANSAITAQNKSNTPGYTTDNPEQTKYYNGASTDTDAQAKIKSSSEGDLMSNGLVSRPKMTISPNDSFLDSSRAIEGNPDQVVAMLTGTYGECKPLTYTSTDSEIRTCDEYEERVGGTCVVGQEVEVEARHSYQCNKTLNYTNKNCTKTLRLSLVQDDLTASNFGNQKILCGKYNPSSGLMSLIITNKRCGYLGSAVGDNLFITDENSVSLGVFTVSSIAETCRDNGNVSSKKKYTVNSTVYVVAKNYIGSNLIYSCFRFNSQISQPPVKDVVSTWEEICP